MSRKKMVILSAIGGGAVAIALTFTLGLIKVGDWNYGLWGFTFTAWLIGLGCLYKAYKTPDDNRG